MRAVRMQNTRHTLRLPKANFISIGRHLRARARARRQSTICIIADRRYRSRALTNDSTAGERIDSSRSLDDFYASPIRSSLSLSLSLFLFARRRRHSSNPINHAGSYQGASKRAGRLPPRRNIIANIGTESFYAQLSQLFITRTARQGGGR
jgi:hypothetical protein